MIQFDWETVLKKIRRGEAGQALLGRSARTTAKSGVETKVVLAASPGIKKECRGICRATGPGPRSQTTHDRRARKLEEL